MNQSFLNIFISWFPMLLLIGVWMFFLRRMRSGGDEFMPQFEKDKLAEMRKQSDLLKRIAEQLEKKS